MFTDVLGDISAEDLFNMFFGGGFASGEFFYSLCCVEKLLCEKLICNSLC